MTLQGQQQEGFEPTHTVRISHQFCMSRPTQSATSTLYGTLLQAQLTLSFDMLDFKTHLLNQKFLVATLCAPSYWDLVKSSSEITPQIKFVGYVIFKGYWYKNQSYPTKG